MSARDYRAKAEGIVIAASLIDQATFQSDCLPHVKAEWFIDPLNRKAWATMAMMAGAKIPIDPTTLVKQLKGEDGAVAHFAKLAGDYPGPATVPYWVDELGKIHNRDTVRNAAERLAIACKSEDANIAAALARFQQDTEQAKLSKSKSVTIAEASRKAIERHRKAIESGIPPFHPSPFPGLDDLTGGFYPGALVLLSGRSYVGKTYFALRLADHLAESKVPTAFFCLEMTEADLAERVLMRKSNFAMYNFSASDFQLEDLDELDKVVDTSLENVPLYLDCSSRENAASIAGKVRYLVAQYGVEVVFIDHLQRLYQDTRQELRHHLKDQCKQLKDLALELNICIILLSQLRIEDDSKEPTAASYSEGKQIFEEADIAILLHKPEKFSMDLKVIVEKARKRAKGEMLLAFDPKLKTHVEVGADLYDGEFADFGDYQGGAS